MMQFITVEVNTLEAGDTIYLDNTNNMAVITGQYSEDTLGCVYLDENGSAVQLEMPDGSLMVNKLHDFDTDLMGQQLTDVLDLVR